MLGFVFAKQLVIDFRNLFEANISAESCSKWILSDHEKQKLDNEIVDRARKEVYYVSLTSVLAIKTL